MLLGVSRAGYRMAGRLATIRMKAGSRPWAESSAEWGRPWLKALRTEQYLFVRYKTGEPEVYEYELYDLKRDPFQLNNIYDEASGDLLERLNAQLVSLEQCEAEGCRTAEGTGAELDRGPAPRPGAG